VPTISAFDSYDRGPHWIGTCGEVAKLRLVRRTAGAPSWTLLQSMLQHHRVRREEVVAEAAESTREASGTWFVEVVDAGRPLQ
jgi:hypothetical protein